jgi:hypothetical protein
VASDLVEGSLPEVLHPDGENVEIGTKAARQKYVMK